MHLDAHGICRQFVEVEVVVTVWCGVVWCGVVGEENAASQGQHGIAQGSSKEMEMEILFLET